MLGIIEKYCPKCGYRIRIHEERFCHCCGQPIVKPEEAPLSEEDVKDIPLIEPSPVDKLKRNNNQTKNKDVWISGSYYFVVGSILLTLILVEVKMVNAVFLPLVLIISLLGTSLIGASQMRHDKTNNGRRFYKLMLLSLKKFLSKRCEVDKPKKTNNSITK